MQSPYKTTCWYRIEQFEHADSDLLLFEVRKTNVDPRVDPRYPIRAFGPASLAMCHEFLALVIDGARDFEAREQVVSA